MNSDTSQSSTIARSPPSILALPLTLSLLSSLPPPLALREAQEAVQVEASSGCSSWGSVDHPSLWLLLEQSVRYYAGDVL